MKGHQDAFDFDTLEKESELQQNEKAFSVSQLTQLIKSQLESQFHTIWVKGEISNFKPHSSGHFYFSLKDKDSQLSAVMFKGANLRLNFRPKDGLEVLVRGKITVYPPRGSYQILCETMEPVGKGGLKEEFEKLKLKLKEEGLFESVQKKPLPFLPFRVALVTSPTSAAVRDMIQVLGRKHPACELVVIPCLTQGEKAATDIIRALDLAENTKNIDVILLARGGGSLEDMWCFNDENLARKIFSLKTPIVSGVGHEVDFTIADFVSDYRAPTPSAAAEVVCKNIEEIKEKIHHQKKGILYRFKSLLDLQRQKVLYLTKRIVDPKKKIEEQRFKIDDFISRIEKRLTQRLESFKKDKSNLDHRLYKFPRIFAPYKEKIALLKKQAFKATKIKLNQSEHSIKNYAGLLKAVSPFHVLERGYSIVRDEKKRILKSNERLKSDQELTVQFSNGKTLIKVAVPNVEEESNGK